jgi:hypothetical protein
VSIPIKTINTRENCEQTDERVNDSVGVQDHADPSCYPYPVPGKHGSDLTMPVIRAD